MKTLIQQFPLTAAGDRTAEERAGEELMILKLWHKIENWAYVWYDVETDTLCLSTCDHSLLDGLGEQFSPADHVYCVDCGMEFLLEGSASDKKLELRHLLKDRTCCVIESYSQRCIFCDEKMETECKQKKCCHLALESNPRPCSY